MEPKRACRHTCSSSSLLESSLESLESLESSFLPLALLAAAGFSSSSLELSLSSLESLSSLLESSSSSACFFFAASSSSRFLRSSSSRFLRSASSAAAFLAAFFSSFLLALLAVEVAFTGVAVASFETDDLDFLLSLVGLVVDDLPIFRECKRGCVSTMEGAAREGEVGGSESEAGEWWQRRGTKTVGVGSQLLCVQCV